MNIKTRTKKKNHYFIFPTVGAVLMVIIFIVSLAVGRYSITFIAAIKALFGNAERVTDAAVIWELRLPRTLVAGLVGIALSLSGLIYQSTLQNELVSPEFLGVSPGASVGVAFGLLRGFPLLAVSGLGFLSGGIAMLFTLAIAWFFKNKSPIMLVLAGILVSGLMGSIVSIIKAYANTETTLPAIVFFLLGSFASVKMVHVWVLLVVVLVCAAILFLISSKLNVIALGREEAKSKGVNYKFWQTTIIIVGTVLTASAVSVAGTIGWAGLVIPHMTRMLVGHTAQKTILVAAFFGGSFMMATDILARTFTNSEIPVGAITGILGILAFVAILIVKKGSDYVVD
ncbi:MAG: iron ABC transporter permease [Treponema sp.]|jgi:iron complex transport system permease protein|nr:iron ABC transporter permease [Treponema sp.]